MPANRPTPNEVYTMPTYKAPLRDMRFLMNEVFDYPKHYSTLSNGADATPDMVEAILGEAAKLCEEVLAPLNQSGDLEGCHFDNGKVTTPKGFKDAYDQYVAGRVCHIRSNTVVRACP